MSTGHRACILILCAGWLAACSPEPPRALRIGINPWPAYEFFYLAQEKGYFADEGVTVKIVEFTSLADARRAYERGHLDLLCGTVFEQLLVHDQSLRKPQAFLVLDYSDGADVVLADSSIASVADLHGKRVSVELGSLNVHLLARALETGGMTLDDVVLVHMDYGSAEEAFRRGTVDAVVSYPPVSANILAAGRAHVVFDSSRIPGEIVDIVAAEPEVLRTRRAELARFLGAYYRAVEFTAQRPDEAYSIMAAREQVGTEEFRAALHDGIRLVSRDQQEDFLGPSGSLKRTIETVGKAMRQVGQLHNPVTVERCVAPPLPPAPGR